MRKVPDKIPFLIYGKTIHPEMEKFILGFAEKGKGELFALSDLKAVVSQLQAVPFGFLFFHLGDNQDLVEQISLLKVIKKLTQDMSVRVFVTSAFKQPHYRVIYERYGCHEFFQDPLPLRSIEFKLKKFVELGERQIENNKKIQQQLGFEYKAKAEEGFVEWTEPEYACENPEDLASIQRKDYWYFEEEKVKKNNLGWMLEVRGPLPHLGQWQELEGAWGMPFWVWVYTDAEFTSEHKENLYWVFYGEKPIYQANLWTFESAQPSLVLHELKPLDLETLKQSKALVYRVHPNKVNQKLKIHKNLEFSKEFLKKMLEHIKKTNKQTPFNVLSNNKDRFGNHPSEKLKEKFDKILELTQKETAERYVEKEIKRIHFLKTQKELQIQEIKKCEIGKGLIGSLGFHYLMSELTVQPDYDFNKSLEVSQEYFQASFSGLKIALYKELNDKWICVSHKEKVLSGEWVGCLSALKSQEESKPVFYQGHLLIPLSHLKGQWSGVIGIEGGEESIRQYPEGLFNNIAQAWVGLLDGAA